MSLLFVVLGMHYEPIFNLFCLFVCLFVIILIILEEIGCSCQMFVKKKKQREKVTVPILRVNNFLLHTICAADGFSPRI